MDNTVLTRRKNTVLTRSATKNIVENPCFNFKQVFSTQKPSLKPLTKRFLPQFFIVPTTASLVAMHTQKEK